MPQLCTWGMEEEPRVGWVNSVFAVLLPENYDFYVLG